MFGKDKNKRESIDTVLTYVFLIFFSSSLIDHPKRLVMPRNNATAVTITTTHTTPDTSAR